MARVVVVGGGLGGLASAVRLAKLGHEVTLLEATDRLGGALGTVEADGWAWDAGATYTLLPAVLRDLFRKSGRPLEREDADLVAIEEPAQHRWEGEEPLDLPGDRVGRTRLLGEAYGERAAREWEAWSRAGDVAWATLRQPWLETLWDPEHVDAEALALLRTRRSLRTAARRELKDPHLSDLALAASRIEGQDPRDVPVWARMGTYVEQTFGRWRFAGGMAELTRLLEARLSTRRVVAHTGVRVLDLEVTDGRVTGVRTPEATLAADHVVVAIDPRTLPALAAHAARTTPAMPPVVAHLGLRGDVPDLPHEVVLHGDPLVVLRTRSGRAPEGGHAWTLIGRGRLAEDVLDVLPRYGLRVRGLVETRVDRSPRDLVEAWSGSPYGVLWQGRGTLRHRLGTRTPIPGVHLAGAHGVPGAGIAQVGLSAALVAQSVGPA